ncbi:NADH-quinone oxidoreductase subunit D [Thermodesulfobium sp.]|jgi:NADH dehydrogenase I D subunit|uniref:NADH-quinone oxidoreductase subunit D n=1 Tax=Thermodesulfobium narugense TaxID=184064 RepID=A0A7C5KBV4_9BACT
MGSMEIKDIKEQILTSQNVCILPETEEDLETKEMILNMGPQHPATHGVLRLVLKLDGEEIVDMEPHIGYLHRGIEKLMESKTYAQALPLTDRLDYISSPANNTAYAIAIEKLFGIEAPIRAKFIRTIFCEMSRICSHLLWLATHSLDIGAMTVFLYCFREREWLLDLFEMTVGARLLTNFARIGGVRCDISPEFVQGLREFTKVFPSRVQEYETLLTKNPIWLERTVGIAQISAEDALNWGLTGPCLRGSGVDYDLRRDCPYDAYPYVKFHVPLGKNGDVYDRYLCRMEELRQSNEIIKQLLDQLPDGQTVADDAPDLVIPTPPRQVEAAGSVASAFITLSKERKMINTGDLYSAVEVPKGELGIYVVSDGSGKPYRLRLRTPSFVHISAMPVLSIGHMVADIIAIIGSIDIVLGESDK